VRDSCCRGNFHGFFFKYIHELRLSEIRPLARRNEYKYESSVPHAGSKTHLGKTSLSLTVLTNVRARPRPCSSRRLFVLSSVLPRILLPTIVFLFDVFPRLQVTKTHHHMTFSLVIIARLKGSPGYVYGITAKKEKGERKRNSRKLFPR